MELNSPGFPLIADNDTLEDPPCTPFTLNSTTCPSAPDLEGAEVLTPASQPWAAPGDSDMAWGFVMLGLVVASMTGKSTDDIYRSAIFEPLRKDLSNSIDTGPSPRGIGS